MPDDSKKKSDTPTPSPAPAKWLRWQGPQYYGGVPTRGSGPNGELSPTEIASWFGARPGLYKQAVEVDHSYLEIAAPDPATPKE